MYHALQPRSAPTPESGDLQVPPPSPQEPATYWTRESWRTWLSTACCATVQLEHMHELLQTIHAHLYDEAIGQLGRCTSPNLYCCNFCLKCHDPETRGINPANADHRHLPDVPTIFTNRDCPAPDEEITGMEAGHGESDCQASSEALALPRPSLKRFKIASCE